jgi:hypothetical protein
MSRRSLLVVAGMACMLACSTVAYSAQTAPGAVLNGAAQVLSAQNQAAADGLKTLKILEQSGSSFPSLICGFATKGEANTAQLGQPFAESTVWLDKLNAWNPRQGADSLVVSGVRVTYPVLVGTTVRCAITVARTAQNPWAAVAFGNDSIMKGADALRTSLSATTGLPTSEFFVVSVLALNAKFLAFRKNGQLYLAPLTDTTKYGFLPGTVTSGEEMFKHLQPAAKKVNPNAPG